MNMTDEIRKKIESKANKEILASELCPHDNKRTCYECELEFVNKFEEMSVSIDKVMKIISDYGHIDGSHYKQWCLDQIARILLGKDYDEWSKCEDGSEFDIGVAP